MKFTALSGATFFDRLTPLFMVAIVGTVAAGAYFGIFQHEIEKYVTGGVLNQQTGHAHLKERSQYLVDLKTVAELSTRHGKDPASPVALVLPVRPDVPSLFVNFEALARRRGVGLATVTITGADARTAGLKEIGVTLKFTNVDYARLKDLLHDLEGDARLVDVTTFSFDPGAQYVTLTAKMYASN